MIESPKAPICSVLVATPGPLALQPRSPVSLRARRTAEGIVISWVRRTRFDGDAWEPLDVPLSEAVESYRVEIRSGAAILRILPAAAPSVLYPAADEIADFGAAQTILDVSVAQESASVGLGIAARELLPVS